MKNTKTYPIFALIILLLAACQPATPTQEPPTATIAPTITLIDASASQTFTPTIRPTSTRRPTKTPAPTDTPLPIPPALTVVPVQPDPLALNESNAGTGMKLLHTWGTGALNQAVFSPKGKYLAAATGRGVYLYDGQTFELVKLIDVGKSVTALGFSPDEAMLALGIEGQVSLWSVESGAQMQAWGANLLRIYKTAYTEGGRIAALGGVCQGCGVTKMLVWDAKTGQQVYTDEINFPTTALVLSQDGKYLYYAARGLVKLDMETLQPSLVLNPIWSDSYRDFPYDFVVDETEQKFFIAGIDGTNMFFASKTQEQRSFCTDSVSLVDQASGTGACVSADRLSLFSLSDGSKKSITMDIQKTDSDYRDVAFRPDGKILALQSADRLQLLEIATGKNLSTLEFNTVENVRAGIALLDGTQKQIALVQDKNNRLDILDLHNGAILRSLVSDCCEIKGFALAPDQKTIATTDSQGHLTLWGMETGQVKYQITLSAKRQVAQIIPTGPLEFLPDGKSILFYANEDAVFNFNMQTAELDVYPRSRLPFPRFHHTISQPGNPVIFDYTGDENANQMRFTDTVTSEVVLFPHTLSSDFDYIEDVAISPDGELYVAGNINGIQIWHKRTQKQLWNLTGHELRGGDGWSGAIRSLRFAPNSNLLISVGWDGTTRLWNAKAGQPLRVLNQCCRASFTPDGRYLVIAGDGVVYVWGLRE